MTEREFIERYVRPSAQGLFVRYMQGATDELDRRILAAMGYGPRFDGFREPVSEEAQK